MPCWKGLRINATKPRPTHICVFTDGRPFSRDIPDTQKHIDAVADLVIGREYPEYCPMTFMSCTDQDCDVGWLKRLDLAPFCAEVDDYISELRDVKKHQGKGFKFFSPGFYLMCCLAAALDPERLDKMDEEKPFTRKTMNEFRGINHSEKEYLDYFKKHPRFKQYRKYQSQFLSERIEAKDIMKTWCCGLFASKPVDFNKKKQQERAIMAARERQQKRQPMLAY